MLEINLSDEVLLALALVALFAMAHLAARLYWNTRAIRSCNRQACLAFASEVYAGIAVSTEMSALFRAGLNDFAALDADQKVQMHYCLQNVVVLFRDSVNAYSEKVITEAEYDSNRAAAVAVLRMPGGAEWWQDAQHAYPKELREALNAEGDLSYALSDIYPYFLFSGKEESGVAAPNSNLAWNKTTIDPGHVNARPEAANEESVESGPRTDWRKGLARRRARQNIVSR